MGGRGIVVGWSAALVLACMSMLVVAPVVSASKGVVGTFGVFGTESGGELDKPMGVAVNGSTGEVYVVDEAEDRVDVFGAEGGWLGEFAGLRVKIGATSGELNKPDGVAVDQSTGAVYVTDETNKRVDVFSADGVFEGAFGWGVINKAAELQFCTTICVAGTTDVGAGGFGASIGYPAVNPSNGNVLVADATNERVDEFKPTFTLGVVTGVEFVRGIGWGVVSNAEDELQVCTTTCVKGLPGAGLGEFGATGPSRVAVDASGSIYAVDPSNFRVEKFTTSGGVVSAEVYDPSSDVTGTSAANAPTDIAVESASGDVLVVKPNAAGEREVLEFGGSPEALLRSDGAGAGITAVNGLAVSPFNGDIYLVSTSSVYVLNTLGAVGASDVADTSAMLRGEINPSGQDTRYHFEYGLEAGSYEASVPVPDGDAGAGTVVVAVSANLQGLRPDTTYHFRLVATNSANEISSSPDEAFTTQATGASAGFALPDGRAWEMVSPPQKEGAGIPELNALEGPVIQAAAEGGAITYGTTGSISAEVAGSRSSEYGQALSVRGPAGWSTLEVATPNEISHSEEPATGHKSEYHLFSSNLSLGLVEPPDATPLSPATTEYTPYLREADGAYLPLVTAANVPPGTQFSNGQALGGENVHFEGASPDLSNVVLSSEDALTPEAVKEGTDQRLYEWNEGRLALVSVLPGGPSEKVGTASLGSRGTMVRNAISANGSRIVWEAAPGGVGEAHLYMRDIESKETVQLDANQGGEGDTVAEAPVFQAAASEAREGQLVFFTDDERLTPGSTAKNKGTQSPDLYACSIVVVAGTLTCQLADLTVDPNVGEYAEVQGVIGASESGDAVYFIAHGVLSGTANPHGETAISGGDNLYVARYDGGTEAWTTTFIAALTAGNKSVTADEKDWEATDGNLSNLTARVSPNGEYLAFMSDRSLTGYDNLDANSGEPDEEVFLYAAGSNRVVCASCNPSGARPVGVYDPPEPSASEVLVGVSPGLLVDPHHVWKGDWLAGSIPGWTLTELNRALYQSRYLSDSGRLFFNSPDALVPGDVNGKEDVYEYEPEGVGGCQSASDSASVTLNEQAGGCVGLISQGTSAEESTFLDASENGDDVFFRTTSQLVAQDHDNAYDVYDAHVCTSESPCPPPSAAVPPACTTTDSCRVAPAPQPSVFGAPPSATFSGAGNVIPVPTSTVKPKAKPLTRAQKLAKALKACKKQPKRKRASCKTQAKKKYAAKAKAKRSNVDTKKGVQR